MGRSEPVPAGRIRYVPVRAGPGRLAPEPEPAHARAGRSLSRLEPLKDRKKRCISYKILGFFTFEKLNKDSKNVTENTKTPNKTIK